MKIYIKLLMEDVGRAMLLVFFLVLTPGNSKSVSIYRNF
jgi:hypothetical protein